MTQFLQIGMNIIDYLLIPYGRFDLFLSSIIFTLRRYQQSDVTIDLVLLLINVKTSRLYYTIVTFAANIQLFQNMIKLRNISSLLHHCIMCKIYVKIIF